MSHATARPGSSTLLGSVHADVRWLLGLSTVSERAWPNFSAKLQSEPFVRPAVTVVGLPRFWAFLLTPCTRHSPSMELNLIISISAPVDRFTQNFQNIGFSVITKTDRTVREA